MNKLPVVKLFTKNPCCLCDTAKFLLKKIKNKEDFIYEEVDIEKQKEYFEEFKYDIPVIFLNNKEISRHRLNESLLLNALKEIKKE